MRNRSLPGLITLFCVLLIATLSYSSEIDEINALIKAKGARWVAKGNAISILSLEEKRVRVGAYEGGALPEGALAFSQPFSLPAAVPSAYDWRNVSGNNYVTPVRDQGNCGSCWAFASTAALESKALITFDWPGLDLNLSEQIVVSCSGAGGCNGGSPSTASNFFVNQGTSLEGCYPYTATKGNCKSACLNWQSRTYRIDGWHYLSTGTAPTESALKNAIVNGPVIAVFDVYDDFFSYHSGVYSYVSGDYAGGHAILIVGWDDVAGAFIVKNSWGKGWGEAGYFRIAYSELTGKTKFASWSYAYGSAVKSSFKRPEAIDFNGDGDADVLWRDAITGQVAIWLMNGTTITSIESPGVVSDLNWQIMGFGDFNGDSRADVLWEHAGSGWTATWLMNGTNVTSVDSPALITDLDWQVKGIGDFNGDGKADVLWHHATSGQVAIWIMNGATISSIASPGIAPDLNWQIKAVGDFNGDGKADVLWYHATTGQVAIWIMNGTTISSIVGPGFASDLNWQIKAVGDFNGDGRADVLWHHATSGQVAIWIMNGATISSIASPGFAPDLNWQVKAVGDFNGDGKADVLWQHAVSGWTAIWLMNGVTVTAVDSPGRVSDLNWQIMN